MRASELLVAAGSPKNSAQTEPRPLNSRSVANHVTSPAFSPLRDGADVACGQDPVGEAGPRPLQDGVGGRVARRAVEAGERPPAARQLVGEGAVQLRRIVVAIQEDDAAARVARGFEMVEPLEPRGEGGLAGAIGEPDLLRCQERGCEVAGGGSRQPLALRLGRCGRHAARFARVTRRSFGQSQRGEGERPGKDGHGAERQERDCPARRRHEEQRPVLRPQEQPERKRGAGRRHRPRLRRRRGGGQSGNRWARVGRVAGVAPGDAPRRGAGRRADAQKSGKCRLRERAMQGARCVGRRRLYHVVKR
jgi:hypothetical protein